MRLDRVGPNTENVHQSFSTKRKKDREHSVALMCEVFWAVQNSSWCFSPHPPVGCCGKQDYQLLSGDCAHTSQSGVDRRNRSGCRSESMMGDSAADSLNRRCVGMSPGTLPSPETQTYRAGSVYLFLKNSFSMRRGLGLGLNFFFFSSYLAEQISEGWAWQYSLVHSGWQLSGSKDSITTQTHIVNKYWTKNTEMHQI